MLLDLKNRYLQGDSTYPQDAEYGFWSLKKLIAINYLIPTFGMLASKGNFTHCFCLDVLAGSGIMKLETDFLPGSAIVSLAAKTTAPHFKKYFFIEKDQTKADLLEKRLGRVAADLGREFEVKPSDCNVALPEILSDIYREDPDRCCFLALADPEGYSETSWSTIETLLSHGKGDLIFNFTEGIARNVQKARSNPSYIPMLRQYFGESEEEWLQLDGYEELIEHFKQKLSNVNEIKRTVFRIDVRDEGNRPLYGLLIATGSTGVANIITNLKERLDSCKVIEMKNVYDELLGRTKSLTSYT